MPTNDRDLCNVAVIVSFSWERGTPPPGEQSAHIRPQAPRLNGPGSSGWTNGDAPHSWLEH